MSKTGDLVLFYNSSCISSCIRCIQSNSITHVGIIVQDLFGPGTFVIQSDLPGGVTLVPLSGSYTIKPIKVAIPNDRIAPLIANVLGKKYETDLTVWLALILNKGSPIQPEDSKQQDMFVCSALVVYLYQKLGLNSFQNIDWTLIRPDYFDRNFDEFEKP